MSGFVRSSHYRHVFVEAPKQEDCYKGFRFAVVPYTNKGTFAPNSPIIAGHKGAVLDFDFNPFHPNLIASASDDSTVKLWGIPTGGLTENLTEALVDLPGHSKKVTLLKFHPTASNILASVAADCLVKVWDIEKACEVSSMAVHGELIQDLQWDHEGSMWLTSCEEPSLWNRIADAFWDGKDKIVRLGDARTNAVVQQVEEAHAGSKSVKIAFLGEQPSPRFVTVGFTKQSQRQLKLWDQRDLSKPVHKVDIDQAAGVILPHYDVDTRVLYLCGKGDGNIRYYEMCDGKPFAFPLSEYRSTNAAKGACFIPKRGVDVMRCETARCLKLTQNGGQGVVEPLSFIVPRKSDTFQEDIFPDTFSGQPSMTADEWLGGANKPPLKSSLNPSEAGNASTPTAKAVAAFVPMRSAAQLQRDVDAAHARIALLEARLKKAGLSTD